METKQELLWKALKALAATRADGYGQAIRDILDGIREASVEIQDPSGDYTAYYPADVVLEILMGLVAIDATVANRPVLERAYLAETPSGAGRFAIVTNSAKDIDEALAEARDIAKANGLIVTRRTDGSDECRRVLRG